jgi:hypothetical protein
MEKSLHVTPSGKILEAARTSVAVAMAVAMAVVTSPKFR